ncbi:MAG: hypothetical protein K0R14_1639 [Burkholderiales bacterium]|jgi:hypothetical protein|nr:hypothetical protein [Burkholderiales bacterium]
MSTAALKLYDQDFYAWTQEQAKLIKIKAFEKLDMANLLEEVESMGKHEKRELANRLIVLLMHLLKWKYQPARQCKSWKLTIKEQRNELKYHLKENPSLTNPDTFGEAVAHAYSVAILKAAEERNLDEDMFPQTCEWTINQLLDDDFLPR